MILEKSMTEFIFETQDTHGIEDMLPTIINYAQFLSKPLNIGMFIPTDLKGNVLVKYIKTTSEDYWDKNAICRIVSKDEVIYQKAKERVIFEGFEKHKRGFFYHNDVYIDEEYCETQTIEDLIPFKLKLTDYAIKKYNL